MLDQLLKMAGVNVDPKKINEMTEFALAKLYNSEKALAGIDASLKDLVDIEKQKLELLKKRGAE